MLGTITWEAGQHRLRLAGSCGEEDRSAVADALAAVGDPGRVLIIDLTAVESLARPVAEVVADICADAQDRRISVLRRHGTDVDRVLNEVGV